MNILRLSDFPTKDVLENRSHEIDRHGLGITHILPLSKELIKAGHTVNVLAGGGMRCPKHENIHGINVYRTTLPLRPYYLGFGPALLFNIKKIESLSGRIDVIHAHNPVFTYGYSFVKRFVGKPIVATVHGTYHPDLIENSLFLKMMASTVDHFIAINRLSFEMLEDFGVQDERISLIPTGVDTDVFTNAGGRQKVVLYAGRLVQWKNVDAVVDIASMLKTTHPEIKFYIVGRGPHEAALRERAEKAGLKNLHFFNNVRYEDMPKFYSNASVLIAPHKYDSFGKTVLEALACETPVIATDFDVPSDIQRCGVFVKDPDDLEAMSNAVLRIVENEDLRKKLGSTGRRIVEKSYTWKKCAERNMGVYRNIV